MKKISLLLLIFFTVNIHADNIQPILTVVTPLEYTDECESYLQYVTKVNHFDSCELFLISNGIDDKNLETIASYMAIYKNIHFLYDHNKSMSALLNKAIKNSSCDFITILNCDDSVNSIQLEIQLHEIMHNPSLDLVYSDFAITYDKNATLEDNRFWYFVELPEFQPNKLYQNIIGFRFIWRKSLHEKNGYFIEYFNYSYLWEFWNRCIDKGAQFKKVPGRGGTYYFNYFKPKKVFFSESDIEKSYKEDKYIRQTYKHVWNKRYNFPEKPFVIITASYKNKNWYKRNLDSILFQNYTNYRIIYIDDNSSDQTGQLVKDYVHAHNKEDIIQVIINSRRCGATENIYNAVHLCNPYEICLIVDGDDWLAHDNVLNHLNEIYQDPNIWLTYGQFQWFTHSVRGFVHALPDSIIAQNQFRDYGWVTSHLRTFYAGLYHRINKEDLCFDNEFYSMAGDLAIMYPMLEMAGHHSKYTNEIFYIYNNANSLNDHQVDISKQTHMGRHIINRIRYKPIEHFLQNGQTNE